MSNGEDEGIPDELYEVIITLSVLLVLERRLISISLFVLVFHRRKTWVYPLRFPLTS